MSHSLIETAADFGNIMPKPNFKTHVIIIEVYLRSPDFLFISQLMKGRRSTCCQFFTYQKVKLIRDQSTFRSSIY